MITVTPVALGKIKEFMVEQDEAEASLRVMIAGMGCGGPQYMMSLDDETKEEDLQVQHDGITIIVDPQSAPMLEGSEIDFVESLDKSGFTVNNPNFEMPAGGGGCGGNCSCGRGG